MKITAMVLTRTRAIRMLSGVFHERNDITGCNCIREKRLSDCSLLLQVGQNAPWRRVSRVRDTLCNADKCRSFKNRQALVTTNQSKSMQRVMGLVCSVQLLFITHYCPIAGVILSCFAIGVVHESFQLTMCQQTRNLCCHWIRNV